MTSHPRVIQEVGYLVVTYGNVMFRFYRILAAGSVSTPSSDCLFDLRSCPGRSSGNRHWERAGLRTSVSWLESSMDRLGWWSFGESDLSGSRGFHHHEPGCFGILQKRSKRYRWPGSWPPTWESDPRRYPLHGVNRSIFLDEEHCTIAARRTANGKGTGFCMLPFTIYDMAGDRPGMVLARSAGIR